MDPVAAFEALTCQDPLEAVFQATIDACQDLPFRIQLGNSAIFFRVRGEWSCVDFEIGRMAVEDCMTSVDEFVESHVVPAILKAKAEGDEGPPF